MGIARYVPHFINNPNPPYSVHDLETAGDVASLNTTFFSGSFSLGAEEHRFVLNNVQPNINTLLLLKQYPEVMIINYTRIGFVSGMDRGWVLNRLTVWM